MPTRARARLRRPIAAVGLCLVVGAAAGCGDDPAPAVDPIVRITTPGPARSGGQGTDSGYNDTIGHDVASLKAPFTSAANVCGAAVNTNCATALVGAEAAAQRLSTDLTNVDVPARDAIIDGQLRAGAGDLGRDLDAAVSGVLDQDIRSIHAAFDQAVPALAALQRLGDRLVP